MRKIAKKSIKYCIFSVFLGILTIDFAVCFDFYRSFVGCYVVPGSQIELNAFTDNTFSVMTYNIKVYYRPQNKEERLNSWKNRAPMIAELLNEYKPSIICMQEVSCSQEFYMRRYLQGYGVVANYRENGISAEGTLMSYRTDLFELIESETFWLSETPNVISKSWGSNCYRICTLDVLKDKRTEKKFVVANTHLDNSADSIRLKQIGVVLNKINQYNLPTLLLGDMNSRSYSKTISAIKNELVDIGVGQADELKGTFNNFKLTESYNVKSDWIFQTNGSFIVNKYAVITNSYNNKYPSDHFPIYAELVQN